LIINGGSRSNTRFFSKHLSNTGENERVTVCEIRNLAARRISEALREMEAVALGTQCRNFFYHANINPLSAEALTPEQWTHAVDVLERNLGLSGHARFVVEHEKKGRTHRHVIWSRIDVLRMRAVAMTDDYAKHQLTARELEREFGLEQGRSVLPQGRAKGRRPPRRLGTWETFRGHTSGIDPYAMRDRVTALYRASADAVAFARALQECGYRLARGDRRDFCIVDAAGHVHSLGRRLSGVPAAQRQQFLKDIEEMMPVLAELRASDAKAP
jgi:Relaxase/Mobilisation nuclease domain